MNRFVTTCLQTCNNLCVLRVYTTYTYKHLTFSFRDLNKLADGIGSKFGRLIYSFSAFFAGYILGFCYLWKLALVMMAVLPIVALSGGVLAKVMCELDKTAYFLC